MADLSGDDCLAVQRYPLRLESARNSLKVFVDKGSDSQKTETSSTQDDSDATEADEDSDFKDAISSLLVTLQGHRVAKRLRSRESGSTVDRELALLYSRADGLPVDTFRPLINAVVKPATDVEIWKQVLQLITTASRLTPPPSVSASYGGTPRTHNSASHQGSEQTKRLLHDALRDELYGCAYVKVAGFYEKYFDGKSWTEECTKTYESIKSSHVEGRWSDFPQRPTEDAVWAWWTKFQDQHLAEARGAYYSTKSKRELESSDGDRQLDLFVKSRDAVASDEHKWSDIRVIGEHTISVDGGQKFLQLARYARNVFAAQPRRRFLHGFILFGTKMELHVFDRSGAYSMEPFDIHEEPERFIRIVAGYCMMSDEELGLDTIVQQHDGRPSVTVLTPDGKDHKVELDVRPIARTAAIVGRGTSCYSARNGKTVVKFSWVSAGKSPTEPELLKLANERGVKGAPRLIGHQHDISTGEMRSPLLFSKRRRVEGRRWAAGRQPHSLSFSGQLASLPLSDDGKKKRKSIDQEQAPNTKKSRSNSQASRLSQVHEANASFNDSQQSQAIAPTDEPFVDRVLYVQATQPAGRPLAEFSDVRQLLAALRDAIKTHRSLFLDGHIIHRDVSQWNIIITDPSENDGLSGALIDLELGAVVEKGQNVRTGLKRMTGTLKYMAIEVLELGMSGARPDLEHTYRHDLESFFYVFLDMCLNCGWSEGKAPKKDPLRAWYALPDYDNIVRAKLGDMGPTVFETLILPKFSPKFECVKSLATALRDILFLRVDKLRTETPTGSPSVLYDQMITAFDKAIKQCAA
ncbi:uncharacterized protein K489DRAFT_412416 [Dissoconium aciculare CBS 342.82]|uniref:Protein kinase domain-containing protein n=1 Tax=Dissoconium aciculare CBS 342.82 TaxID=1314786 RepID=A0A6J3LWN7_9PEZI|nr:uncharacterized protein K489DRAFT_412416 [Dissoconium aciculare CBS 342.82]KAF1819704.1 hypothetical protein K489DRAFT_412416 [Dissoconium aciculare CBS 342.82]